MDKAEKAAAIVNDPVPRLRARLIAEGFATEAELSAVEAQIEADLDDAVEFALGSPYPELVEMKRDVYATEIA